MKANGKAVKYGNNVDTDVIIPARYLNTSEPEVLAAHCMEDLDPDFSQKAKPGDLIIALDNFGCGSSREHAPIAIQSCGISCVIAKSFARIFYRNAVNIGLPIIECPQAADEIAGGDQIEVDFEAGMVTNLTQSRTYSFEPFPPFLQSIIAAKGLISAIELGLLDEKH